MTGQVQKVIIGGVQYDRNNVKSSGQKDGTHTVELKDGTTITYKTQAQGHEAQVTVNKDKTVVFSGLAGATITDVAGQDDKYLFSGSQNCTVKARHTSVFTKDSDQFYFNPERQLSNGAVQETKYIIIEGNEGDKTHGRTFDLFDYKDQDQYHYIGKNNEGYHSSKSESTPWYKSLLNSMGL